MVVRERLARLRDRAADALVQDLLGICEAMKDELHGPLPRAIRSTQVRRGKRGVPEGLLSSALELADELRGCAVHGSKISPFPTAVGSSSNAVGAHVAATMAPTAAKDTCQTQSRPGPHGSNRRAPFVFRAAPERATT